jgi:hypothetical protein
MFNAAHVICMCYILKSINNMVTTNQHNKQKQITHNLTCNISKSIGEKNAESWVKSFTDPNPCQQVALITLYESYKKYAISILKKYPISKTKLSWIIKKTCNELIHKQQIHVKRKPRKFFQCICITENNY